MGDFLDGRDSSIAPIDCEKKTIKIRQRFAMALLLACTVMATAPLALRAAPEVRVVDITAKRFEFSPNVITIKRGEPVVLRVKSADVTHGLYSKQLNIHELIEPGKTVEVRIASETPGTFTLICDHFCGAGHANMKMAIVVE